MKKLIIISTILLFCLVANSQWYSSFNVTNINELSEDQLNLALDKSLQTIKAGQITTGVGLGVVLIGGIIYASGLNDIVDDYEIDKGVNKGMAGAYLMYGGALAVGVGIPVWISGEVRKNDIEIALVKFKPTSSLGMGIRIRF